MDIVYLNGEYLPLRHACISPLDRGFLFGDGVYEIIGVHHGKLFASREHLLRLQASLKAIKLPIKIGIKTWEDIFIELVKRNKAENKDKYIYLQVTRGADKKRTHIFPKGRVRPTVFVMLGDAHFPSYQELCKGYAAITRKDIRWDYCHVKAIALLANVLASQEAEINNATETIFIHDGYAIEGSNSNLFIVKDNVLITPPKSKRLLGGITRELILKLAKQLKISCKVRNITKQELFDADEVWVTSAARDVMPIIKLDKKLINKGKVGPIWQKVQLAYQEYKEQ
ncbi:MAG: aminotransferase class IV [Gammaproteobacteria bacterium]|jgi:D-alanine transaminase